MDIIDYAGTKILARVFIVPVNAKNSYGGYTGEKPSFVTQAKMGEVCFGSMML